MSHPFRVTLRVGPLSGPGRTEMMTMPRLLAVAVLLVTPLVASGCGADPTDPGASPGVSAGPPADKIAVAVREWAVVATSGIAPAGEVTFAVTNFGTVRHEFLVVRTDYGPGAIPTGKDDRIDERADGVEVVDEIPEFAAGTTGVLTVKLLPGRYELLCNIQGHYGNGMHSPLVAVG